MKKIIIIAVSLFVLSSCGGDLHTYTTKNNVEKKTVKNNVSEKNIIDENIDSSGELTIDDIEKNLEKLKDVEIGVEDLEIINGVIVSQYNEKIQLKALKSNDISVCDKIDKVHINDCKKRFYIASNDIKSCDLLPEEDMKRICKNSILEKQASKNLDETICEKLTFQKQETPEGEESLDFAKEEINRCKDRILTEKAVAKKDLNICKKLNSKNEISICEELVNMENIDNVKKK